MTPLFRLIFAHRALRHQPLATPVWAGMPLAMLGRAEDEFHAAHESLMWSLELNRAWLVLQEEDDG